MRADRLVSLVLLLRQRGRLSAATLARELEVSTRTVLRDIEALSAAGVPVYAERGRLGGFALLPGFRTELTGLNHDEALALLVAGSRRGAQVFGLGSALASAVLKVVDALPEGHRDTAADAARRLLIDPDIDLLARSTVVEEVPDAVAGEVRRAVFAGHKLRIRYAAAGRPPKWRTVDPIGLVTVRGQGYLLAKRSGEDRTYRLDRVLAAEELDDPAQRPDRVDLDRAWQERSTRFRSGGDQIAVLVRLHPERRGALVKTALSVLAEEPEADGRLRLEVTFQDAEHAEWALWQLAGDAEALAPQWLRAALLNRAAVTARCYETAVPGPGPRPTA
ncbi:MULTISPECIES: helix-turn-helix transcriptional regulator [Streptomyces]|uniref:WYL domain-containing protein n=1 Tax=Streptomyces tsukubensis (strain DSM 42081 / NBRC 108919 / NRRL 18488 / 9993) TaxID=1114943 RepID=I2MXF6_STRT9|nr:MULTISPECIES: WYL domain-containing protein [Streptomyces]AZK93832.1 DNA-binding transcriptional regulator [Streptomyces tsukubensis]EIF89453.1 helix-turn-helix type 11 domain-containing protein [Streptomyces tsukubensis NRRL18488]MYS65306.1 WYL domain-containing protein [Streptomyces sp. SID5473]QKM70033.1 WYL domain-containing protein [Streptomyces tsukubensis NRRL18488]TAI45990.1 WYL domain-containing protein [Streptomyces tsukubensis]